MYFFELNSYKNKFKKLNHNKFLYNFLNFNMNSQFFNKQRKWIIAYKLSRNIPNYNMAFTNLPIIRLSITSIFVSTKFTACLNKF